MSPRALLVTTALPVLLAGCATTSPPAPVVTAADSAWSHALVIDASSSASTLHAYRWRPDPEGGLPRIEEVELGRECEYVEPGLAHYGSRPEAAVASLEPLLGCAIDFVGEGPDVRARAALHLRATAGLRLLPVDQQEGIRDAVGAALDRVPFGTTSARLISGAEEGIFGWLSVNYLLGRLGPGDPVPTFGALDLGGASTQVTFAPRERPREHGQAITLNGRTHHVYTYSYLGLGQDEARKSVASPACYLEGFPIPGGGVGTGDYDGCRAAIRVALGRPCVTPPCSMFGVYQPPLRGEFLGLSVYAYAASFFDLDDYLSPASLEEAGRQFCDLSWTDLVQADPTIVDDRHVEKFCFSAAYSVTLLTDGFGLPFEAERVRAPIRVEGNEVGWALGALLYELAGDSD